MTTVQVETTRHKVPYVAASRVEDLLDRPTRKISSLIRFRQRSQVVALRHIIQYWNSDLPTGSFMVSLLLSLLPHLPEVETSPEEKRDDGKR